MKTNMTKKKKQMPSSDLNDINDNHIVEAKEDARIGDKLRHLRQKKGHSFKDIAGSLRISEAYLQALEAMDCKVLPERVYTLGFVRSYAHYLGLEPQEAVNQFKKEFYLNDQAERLSLPEPVMETSRANWKVILISTVVVGIIIFSWYHLSQKKRAPEPMHAAMAAQDIVQEEPAPVEETPTINMVQKSWIEHNLIPKEQKSSIPMSTISEEQTP